MTKPPRELFEIPKGEAIPTVTDHTTPRDLQFQLFTLALFEHAGISCTHEEPDFIFEHQGKKLGVAAKRIKSSSTIEKRISEACKQISDASILGIIALDVGPIIRERDKFIAAESAEIAHQVCNTLINKLIDKFILPVVVKRKPGNIIGFVIYSNIPVVLPSYEIGVFPILQVPILQDSFEPIEQKLGEFFNSLNHCQ